MYSTLATGQKGESHKYVPRSIHICIAQHPTVIPVLEGTYWCTKFVVKEDKCPCPHNIVPMAQVK